MNLTYHYQPVVHNVKNELYLHEAFSTRSGMLYSVNPLPVEVTGDSEEDMEETLKVMESDSTKYRSVVISSLVKEMQRWVDEVEIESETVVPEYEDESELEEDYYKPNGEVFDLVEFINRRK